MASCEAVGLRQSERESDPPLCGTLTSGGGAEARLKVVIESAPASLVVASPEGTVLAANRHALALLGMSRLENLLGMPLADCVAGQDRERFRQFVRQINEGVPASLEYELASPAGATRHVETRAVPLSRSGGATAAFLSVTWDITDRKRAAAATQQQAETRRALLEAQMLAQREEYEAGLRDAKVAYDEILLKRANERRALYQMIRDAHARMQARLARAEEQQQRLAAEWESERETLHARLREADERYASARREERHRYRVLLEEREQWQNRLTEMLQAITQANRPVEPPVEPSVVAVTMDALGASTLASDSSRVGIPQ